MASTRNPTLHDNLIGGVETTLPAHLLRPNQWRSTHNMRFTPALTQVPKKKVNSTLTSKGLVLWLGTIPSYQPGFGRVLALTPDCLCTINGVNIKTGLITNSSYRRWATTLYNGSLYYCNDLNPIRSTKGTDDTVVANAPSGRYLAHWYDHLVVGYPTYQGSTYSDRVMFSDLYKFSQWEPDNIYEADHYDFVEWQSTDYPYAGITGLAKLGEFLWVFTPTAIVPMQYVGRPKVFQVVDQLVLRGVGNTYPWTLAAMNNVVFFFDGVEKSFFAFDGRAPQPVGEPIKQYMKDNLNTSPTLAAKMWASVDAEATEVVWRFCSTVSTGDFDRCVRYNYRYNVWSTGSDENVHAFCGSIFRILTAGELTGTAGALTGTAGLLGTDGTVQPRMYGSVSGSDGKTYKDEVAGDAASALLTADDPVLETGDFHYGHIGVEKETDFLLVNAYWYDGTKLQCQALGREHLSSTVDWTVASTIKGNWRPTLPEGRLTFPAVNGKVLRYRFVGTGLRGLRFDAFMDGVRGKGAEQ